MSETKYALPEDHILRRRGLVLVVVALFIGLAVYFIFPFRNNQKRVVDLYAEKARVLLRYDEYDGALDAIQKASLADPSDLQIRREKLKTEIFQIVRKIDALNRLMDLESLDRAELECKQLLEQDPGNAEVTALMGIIYAHKDQPALALETYKKASGMDPSYPNVRNFWGYSAYRWHYPENWRELAEQKYNEAQRLDPTYPTPRINFANLQAQDARIFARDNKAPSFRAEIDTRFQAAINTLIETEKIGRNEILYLTWGYVLDEWGKTLVATDRIGAYKKFSLALEKYRMAEALNPYLAIIHFNKAEALDDVSNGPERTDEAIGEYKKAIELEPGLVDAYIAIGDLLIKRRDSERKSKMEARVNYAKAIEVITKIIDQYTYRKSRTTDSHALRVLGTWTDDRNKKKLELDLEVRRLDNELAVGSQTGGAERSITIAKR